MNKMYSFLAILVISLILFSSGYYVGTRNSDIQYLTKTDTLINTTFDTVYQIVKSEKLVPIKTIEKEIMYLEDTLTEYQTGYKDSVISGTVYSKIDGKLIDQKFEYTLKQPTITKTVVKEINMSYNIVKSQLLVGLEYGTNISIGAGYYHKDNYLIKYNYRPNNNIHTFGVYKSINFKK